MFNNSTSLTRVLIPKLLNITIACCSLINLDFLLPHFSETATGLEPTTT